MKEYDIIFFLLVTFIVVIFLVRLATIQTQKEGFLSHSRGTFLTASGPVEVDLEVTETPKEIEYGLMNRTSLPPKTGMLFVFPDEAERSFWMRNTLIPLDMIFINKAGRIIHIEHSATPKTETNRTSKGPAQYVVELPGGSAHTHKIRVGDRFSTQL